MKTEGHNDESHGAGVLNATMAFLLWGLFPLYFHAIGEVPPVEILAHRMVWSLAVVVGPLLTMPRNNTPRGPQRFQVDSTRRESARPSGRRGDREDSQPGSCDWLTSD